MRLAALAFLFALAGAGPTQSQSITASAPRLTSIEMFALHQGVNQIPHLASDGRDGLIIQGWRDNGNAHGFDVFMVLLPTSPGGSDQNVVVFSPESDATSITDSPHTGEDFVRSVRFGRAVLNGRRETIALVATRRIDGPHPDPAPAMIQILVLHSRGENPVGPIDFFEETARFQTARLYCHSDAALHAELGVALPRDYDGPHALDGCP